jgi:hypothetical protein
MLGNLVLVLGCAALVGFGYLFAVFMIGRDPSVVTLGADELIVKKPTGDLILVAVTPEVARRLSVLNRPETSTDARRILLESAMNQ